MKKLLILLISSVLMIACKSGNGSKKDAGTEKPIITVTIEPLRYFTEAIAGDEYTVVSMVPKGSSPETYDPTPQQLVELAKSKAYFRIGHIGFERVWADRLADNAPHLQFFELSRGIELIFDTPHQHVHSSAPESNYQEEEMHHTDEADGERPLLGVEPHIWNSPNQCPNHCRKHTERPVPDEQTERERLSGTIQHAVPQAGADRQPDM